MSITYNNTTLISNNDTHVKSFQITSTPVVSNTEEHIYTAYSVNLSLEINNPDDKDDLDNDNDFDTPIIIDN